MKHPRVPGAPCRARMPAVGKLGDLCSSEVAATSRALQTAPEGFLQATAWILWPMQAAEPRDQLSLLLVDACGR